MIGRRREVVATVVGLGLLAATVAQAAGTRKLKGTLCELTHDKIVVMVKEGKVSAALTPETKYRKGRMAISPTDLEISQRVIVKVVEKEGVATATEVVVPLPPPPHERK